MDILITAPVIYRSLCNEMARVHVRMLIIVKRICDEMISRSCEPGFGAKSSSSRIVSPLRELVRYVISQFYLQPDRGDDLAMTPAWYSIYRPQRDERLS